jgi:DNA invertase Pin-like site-specific DNA recombinase
MIFGYARVSTDGQSVNAQVAALRKHGAGRVFREVASGAKTDRAQLRRVIDQLDAGDVLMVTRLDRLARSTLDLLNTLAAIADREAGFRSLGDAWADTTTPHGRLMVTVLGGLAEFERDLIRTRTSEGRERAKARGVKLGRKPKLTEHQKREATAGVTSTARRCARSAAATMSATARFHGSSYDLARQPRHHTAASRLDNGITVGAALADNRTDLICNRRSPRSGALCKNTPVHSAGSG